MNAKCVFALILALQVSTSLCEECNPSQELEDKYLGLRDTFLSRLENGYERFKKAFDEYVKQDPTAAAAMTHVQQLLQEPVHKAAVESFENLRTELKSPVEKRRKCILGYYEKNLRPHIGTSLDEIIKSIKSVLDKILPTPEPAHH